MYFSTLLCVTAAGLMDETVWSVAIRGRYGDGLVFELGIAHSSPTTHGRLAE